MSPGPSAISTIHGPRGSVVGCLVCCATLREQDQCFSTPTPGLQGGYLLKCLGIGEHQKHINVMPYLISTNN